MYLPMLHLRRMLYRTKDREAMPSWQMLEVLDKLNKKVQKYLPFRHKKAINPHKIRVEQETLRHHQRLRAVILIVHQPNKQTMEEPIPRQ
jgi:hypothetical protein